MTARWHRRGPILECAVSWFWWLAERVSYRDGYTASDQLLRITPSFSRTEIRRSDRPSSLSTGRVCWPSVHPGLATVADRENRTIGAMRGCRPKMGCSTSLTYPLLRP